MTTLREAAEQALNFLDNCDLADSFNPPTSQWGLELREALRTALAEHVPETNFGNTELAALYWDKAAPPEVAAWLSANPPKQREPVRLTDAQIAPIWKAIDSKPGATWVEFARAIESAVLKANLGEKT